MSGVSAAGPRPQDEPASDQRSHEPSMEEILASIRRIISDDQMLPLSPRASVPPLPRFGKPLTDAEHGEPPKQESGSDENDPSTAPEIEALHATDQAAHPEPSGLVGAAAPGPFSSTGRAEKAPVVPTSDATDPMTAQHKFDHDDHVVDGHHDASPSGSVSVPADVSHGSRDIPAETPAASHENILSDHTQTSVASSFHQLAATMLLQNFPPVEDIARELLRPMLKTWLDDNLPVVVERLVRAEIERVSRGVR